MNDHTTRTSSIAECADKVLSWLSSVARMEHRTKVEEEREQTVPDDAATPTAETSPSNEPLPRRRTSSNKLQRQEKPIREGRVAI